MSDKDKVSCLCCGWAAGGEELYKINCFCSNCGADKIKLQIPKGTKADIVMNEAVCPKCKCNKCLVRDMLHTLGSESE